MKGHKGYHHTHGTHEKIEKHIRKHRASGGKTGDISGKDDAEEDLKDNPSERTPNAKPEKEAEEKHAKAGGAMKGKKMVMATGGMAHSHAGRKPRASGGGCESQPFTTAERGRDPRGHKTERESWGKED